MSLYFANNSIGQPVQGPIKNRYEIVDSAIFAVDFRQTIDPAVDEGAGATYVRSGTTGTITDNLDRVVDVDANEPMFDGVIRVSASNYSNTGVAESTVAGFGVWKAATNFADTDDPNTQTIDLSGQATGDYVVWCKGTASFTITAGTATATISDATVTEASPGYFDMTVAGTMIITLDSGTLDTSESADNIIQLEAGTFPTPFIPASGGGGTRSLVEIDYGSANYTDEMSVFIEFYAESGTTGTESQALFYMSDSAFNDAVFCYITDANALRVFHKESGAAKFDWPSFGLPTNQWHRVAFTCSATASNRTAYLDGTVFSGSPTTNSDYSGSLTITEFPIGRKGDDTLIFNGRIRDFQIVHSVVSTSVLEDWTAG